MRRLVALCAIGVLVASAAPGAAGELRPAAVGRDPVRPFFASDGRRVAFPRFELRGAQVSVFDLETGAERVIPVRYSYAFVRFARPDRILIDNQTSLDIFTMDGAQLAHLDPRQRGIVTWAPDGTALAYTATRPSDFREEIKILDLRTGEVRDFGFGYEAAWSPDGQEVAVARQLSDGSADIVVRRADGTSERKLTNLGRPIASSGMEWSPDGRALAIDHFSEIVVLRDGQETHIPAPRSFELAWAPDSSRLAVLNWYETLLVDADGGRRVSFEPVTSFAWGPGGEVLYTAAGALYGRPSLGGDRRLVTRAERFAQSLDGRHLALVRRPDPGEESDCLEDRLVIFDRATRSERVLGVCWIEGSSGNDDLRGSPWADELDGFAGADRLNGRGGDDLLRGWGGRDRLTGGSGRDRLSGGPHGDRLVARDGEADMVDCGTGRDRAVVDRIDTVARNCERVFRG